MFNSQMGFLERFSLLIRANLNDLLGKAEDPLNILDQSIAGMEDDLAKLRQVVSIAIVSQKRLQNQFDQAELEINHWYECTELVLRHSREDLAREVLFVS